MTDRPVTDHPTPAAGAPPHAPTVQVEGLVKTFGNFAALDGVDLTVQEGTVHGFLGPNGAGKSTTIRVLLGLYRATAGRVRVLGLDPGERPADVTRQVSYVPGDVALWPTLTGQQVLDVLAGLRGTRDEARERELVEAFALDPTRRVRTYSTGNRQKVMLVAAFAAPTPLLVLDEPTSGLDPLMEAQFREVVGERRGDGRTVLLSSHILSEVEHLCDRVSIIRAGRVVESGTLAQLRHLTRTQVEVELAGPVPEELRTAPGVHDAVVDGHRLTCQVDDTALGDLLARLLPLGVRSLQSSPPTLEQLFLRHYDGSGR